MMRRIKPKKMHIPLIVWVAIGLFVLFYPMLISIYVFLPLLIGVMGYLLILGVHKNRTDYIVLSSIYFINLEINLSLPFFLTIIISLLVYVLFYRGFTLLRQCKLCTPVFTVLSLDFFYLGALLAYDFMFQTTTIVLDNILLYSLVIDLLVVVVL